jgi:malate/lactate dehydrogenase
MVAALAHGDAEPWPASVLLDGEYGVENVALSVPVTLGPGGVHAIHEWPLTGDEAAGMRRAAELVAGAAGELSAA